MLDNTSYLKIRMVDEKDYGTYECIASNSEGIERALVDLTGELGNLDPNRNHSICNIFEIKINI